LSKESSLESERFFQLLFELSHESRYRILKFLEEKPLRVTDLAKRLDLTSQEVSRHVSRLNQIKVVSKDYNNFYNLTPLGFLCLRNLEGLSFTSNNFDYFNTHNTACLPGEFLKRLSELDGSVFLDNVMDFLQYIVKIIQDAQEYVLLVSDYFPVHALSEVKSGLEKGLKIKIIEPTRGFLGPRFSLDSSKENAFEDLILSPIVDKRSANTNHIFVLASEKEALFALPTIQNEINYRGYYIVEQGALKWVHDLFTNLWTKDRLDIEPVESKYLESEVDDNRKRVVIYGFGDPEKDWVNLQKAVDKYEEVILRGDFNLGENGITISRAVKIKGDGREKGMPSTFVYMSGWQFPFNETFSMILVDAENCDISIENIFFNDYKFACIHAVRGNKITIKDNWMVLDNSIGRGRTNPLYGDSVIGIIVNGPGIEHNPGFKGGVYIENNYINFASSFTGGYFNNISLLTDTEREKIFQNHKYFNSFGIYVRWTRGTVKINKNVIKNTSSRGITISENYDSAKIFVTNNLITSDIPGSHVIDSRWSGIGIDVEPGYHYEGYSFQVSIKDNKIVFNKPRYCGVSIKGLMNAPPGSIRLKDGEIIKNSIHLEKGSIGILIESCENYKILNNHISGSVYYGIGFFPGSSKSDERFGASNNYVNENDLSNLMIREPDNYSKALFKSKFYRESEQYYQTSHIFLNNNSIENIVNQPNITLIDDGIRNQHTPKK
jgi:predicted transcriptional regulator